MLEMFVTLVKFVALEILVMFDRFEPLVTLEMLVTFVTFVRFVKFNVTFGGGGGGGSGRQVGPIRMFWYQLPKKSTCKLHSRPTWQVKLFGMMPKSVQFPR